MATVQDFYRAMDDIAPFHTAMDFDNVGLLVGDQNKEVHRVLLSLDITPRVVVEARGKNVDLIISHHPVIFHPLRELAAGSAPYLLAQAGIAAICCHTNLDIAPDYSVACALAQALGLRNIHGEQPYATGYLMHAGTLPAPLAPAAFARHVAQALDTQVTGVAGSRPVSRVFVCGGAGGDYLRDAVTLGADAFVTGEIDYHEQLEAAQTGITVLAAGHNETERCFVKLLLPYLQKAFPQVGVICSQTGSEAFTHLD